MRIDNVSCSARREQPADIRRVHPLERDDIGRRLADQPREPDLPIRPADSLGQGCGGNRDAGASLTSAGEEHHHAPIVSVKREQPSGIEGDTRHQAVGLG